jgi:hypothetical protein
VTSGPSVAEAFPRLTTIYGFTPEQIGQLTIAQLEAYCEQAADNAQVRGGCPMLGDGKK